MTDAPAWFTDALAAEPELGSIDVEGASIAYRAWGEAGDARHDLLLVHGGAAHAGWWDFIAPMLATGRRVVAIDLSGHGDSGHRAAYSMDLWARELAAAVGGAGLRARPVIVGHSLGGMIATVLAQLAEPELGGLIVVDSPIEPQGPWPRTEADNTFGRARVYATRAAAVERFRPIPPQASLPYTAAHIASTSVREVEGGWSWKFDPGFVGMTGDLPHTMDGLTCPAVYIAGEHGILSPGARALLEASSEVPVLEIRDAGHAMMLDQPLPLSETLRGALAEFELSEPQRAA
ncbi:alpha/beta fold hydrolase [Microbacterium sp. cf046]|uniref:alpha/beta fold hydrolase n=1 Tax=Microbacterium sp. cf046 TaxID=1761803 RepID=UPI000B835736|nr:alpha/beta hydrolase [Microbacterium sp. cf046]